MDKQDEDYEQKAKNIFALINKFRSNPREFARQLEKIKRYLDPATNILSEPNKIQIQMVEGEKVFDEAIHFLRKLKPLNPLIWDENLTKAAQEHVDDIGPKGLLLYQSSDGTEPEDRIQKYGTYVDALGENIDFGPNDEMGVVVSLTLDDGEEERPHRENLFKSDYQKIGIACGVHQTEFQMCVMDFAYDFIPADGGENKGGRRGDNEYEENNNVDSRPINANNNNSHVNNQSPYVKLSLDNEEFKGYINQENNPPAKAENKQIVNENHSEIEQLAQQMKQINMGKKVTKKTVEIITQVTYTYEDGSTKETIEKQTHTFNE